MPMSLVLDPNMRKYTENMYVMYCKLILRVCENIKCPIYVYIYSCMYTYIANFINEQLIVVSLTLKYFHVISRA